MRGQVGERVRPLVAVQRRVGERADAAGVHDDHGGTGHVEWIPASR